MNVFLVLQIACAGFLVSTVAVPLVRIIALRLDIVDRPSARKVHVAPTPLLGGAAVYFGFLAAVTLARHHGLVGASPETAAPLRGIVIGSFLIFFMGVIDDRFGLSPSWKLVGQTLTAILLVLSEVRLSIFIREETIPTLVTILWIVGIINAFNLMDNMNGLSAGTALIAAGTFAWVAHLQHDIFVGALAAALAGALAGFLPHNFPKARIFMGDGGSMVIGFILAALSVQGIYLAETKLTHLPVITPILILSVPLFDTASVIIIRLARGLPVFQADKNHFSHRLVDLGMTHTQAVLFIYLVAIAASIPVALLTKVTLHEALLLLVQETILFTIIVVLMRVGIVRSVTMNAEAIAHPEKESFSEEEMASHAGKGA